MRSASTTAPGKAAAAISLAPVRHLMFDLDGTLYLGDKLFPGTKALLTKLRETGRTWCYITNNSSHSTKDCLAKLERLGVETDPKQMITSGGVTAEYLVREAKARRIYVLGTPSLERELAEAGLELADEGVDAVVLGMDLTFTWQKFAHACHLLREGAAFVATHPDLLCPAPRGQVPDCGSLTAAFVAATGMKPVVIGKPNPAMLNAGLGRFGAAPAASAVVGDRLYTDMELGHRGGLTTILLLTGETTAEMARIAHPAPHLVLPGVDELSALL